MVRRACKESVNQQITLPDGRLPAAYSPSMSAERSLKKSCESMPEILQYVSDIMPAKWYIIMVKKVMIEGVGIAYILKELSILSFMMVVLFFVSIKSFKTRF